MPISPRLRAFLVTGLPPLAGGALVLLSLPWGVAPATRIVPGVANPSTLVGLWIVLTVVAAVAAIHRPLGGRTLAAGAIVVPAALALFGPPFAALLAGLAVGVGGLASDARPPWSRWLLRHARAAMRYAVAVLAAGFLAGFHRPQVAASFAASVRPLLAALVGYLLLQLAFTAADRLLQAVDPRPMWRRSLAWRDLPPLAIEAVAWLAGCAAVVAGRRAGWWPVAILLAAIAAVSFEAARNRWRLRSASRRLEGFDRVRQASERMIGPGIELAAVIDRIRSECVDVVDCSYFALALHSAEDGAAREGAETAQGSARRWWAGPDGALREGIVQLTSHPPPIPGVHRRSEWQILTRSLGEREGVSARLRLWCDPRRLVDDQLTLFDALLPQMSASLHQALLDREAREDPLTGAAVRRVLERRLAEAYVRAVEGGGAFGVILCDLDHFKAINDTHGHGAGDQALIAVAQTLATHKRDRDLFARYGGEEFALLLEDIDGPTALTIADRLRQRVAEIDLEVEGRAIPLRMSAGIAVFPEVHIKTASELFLLADEALYQAKDHGRNTCLLQLGGGRYRHPDGRVLGGEAVREARAPQLFA
ncbi:MAG: GGDEF domain-containing protein [Acidobacteriota bacterium]